jgi:hypothetical protein
MRRRRPTIKYGPSSHANNLAALSGGFFFVYLTPDSIHRLRSDLEAASTGGAQLRAAKQSIQELK